MPQFAIIGLSSFGSYLAKGLVNKNCQVMAIDNDEEKIEEIKPFVHEAVIADATEKDTLASLGLKDMDVVVVSLGNKIDSSILVTLYLKEFGIKNIIVKALSEDHGRILQKLGATKVIFPERDMALKLAGSLSSPNVLDYLPLAPGYSIIEMAPPPGFVGKTLGELDLRKKFGVQVIVIKGLVPEKVILVPTAQYIIKDSDILVTLGKNDDLEKIQNLK